MNTVLRAGVASTLMLLSTVAFAQNQGNPPPGGPMGGQQGNGPMNDQAGGPGGGAGGGGPRGACREDVQKYCNNIQPGGGRIIECLNDHYKDISDACYNMIQKVAARRGGGQGGGNDGPPPPPPGGNSGNNNAPPPGKDDGDPNSNAAD